MSFVNMIEIEILVLLVILKGDITFTEPLQP